MALPILTIQPSFQSVVADVRNGVIPHEDIWVSSYEDDSSHHGKVRVILDDTDRNLVRFIKKEGTIDVHYQDGEYYLSTPTTPRTRIQAPSQTYSDPFYASPSSPHRITAFDVSPSSSHYAVGFLDGTVSISPTPSNRKRIHKSTCTSLRFFPSSKVLLSASADFSLQILSADSLTAARTLVAHTRPVTDTAIVGVGRTVVSGSKDRSVRVWDVSGGECVRKEVFEEAVERLEAAEDVVYACTVSGVYRVDLRTSDKQEQVIAPGGVAMALDANNNNNIAVGDAQGTVRVFDARAPWQPLREWTRAKRKSVLDLAFMDADRVVVCTEDTMGPYIAGPAGAHELIGADCYDTRHVRVRGKGDVWTAADDGVVRRYHV